MKKIYSLFLALFASVAIYAQMTISTSGSTVTFSYTLESSTWNSTPVYLYAYVDAADTTDGTFQEILGSWPGTELTGSGPYTATVDLSSFYAGGVTINDISFIYNDSGSNQNPPSGSSSFTASANATGWSSVTITTLGTNELNATKKNIIVANGKLYTSQKGNLSLEVYDFSGRLVKSLSAKSDGNPIDLQVSQSGKYLVKVTGEGFNEVVKFVK